MNGEPIVRIRCLPRGLVALAGVLSLISIAGPRSACADPVSELASFSIFDKVDLAQLAKSDVKTAHGPPMKNSRFLAVQSCYVAPGSPAQQMEALRRWNPAKYRELKVFLHSDLPSNPGPASFERLKNAPDNASVRSFVTATQKLSPELQISKDEAKRFSAATGRWRRRYTSGSRGVLDRCADRTNEKLCVRRNGGTTALRSCRSVGSCERGSEWFIARPRKDSPAVLGTAWSHGHWTRRWFAASRALLGTSRR